MHKTLHSACFALLLATALARPAAAQNPCTPAPPATSPPAAAAPGPSPTTAAVPPPSPDCAVIGKLNISIGLGGGVRTNPVRGKSDMLLPVIPHVSFYGKRFFLENLELGYTLYDGRTHSFSIIAAPGYDRAFFFRGDLQNIFVSSAGNFITADEQVPIDVENRQEFRVPRPSMTYLVGPEWTFGHRDLVGQLNVLREVTGEHDGTEVRAALAAPIIDSAGRLVLSAGLTWKSARVVRYYYGVEGLYEPGSAVNPFLKLGYTLPLSDRWGFNAFAHYERLDSEISDSPIVSDSGVATIFAGFVFRAL